MVRRIAAGLGAAAAISAAVLAAPATAYAANGPLIINGFTANNPSGCVYNVPPGTYLGITNQTDQIAAVYAVPGCQGPIIADVPPQDSGEFHGSSVGIR